MRPLVILVSVAILTGAACAPDGVMNAPAAPGPSTTLELPPPPQLTLTIPSVTVLRPNGREWLYRPQVVISETSGLNGARVIAWGAGPSDGPPISYDTTEGWCGDPRLVSDPAVSNLPLNVPRGGRLDLTDALRSVGCSPYIWSTDPESSLAVSVILRDDHGRNVEVAGSVVVP
jgi:hypothetical protein